MGFDPEILKQLIETFKVELEEQSQVMTDQLLKLEKVDQPDEERAKSIETIFRAAHNIKGAARGIGVTDVGEIAHHIESLFSSFRDNTMKISSNIIDLCLEAVDSMGSAMESFSEKTPIIFDLADLLYRLENTALASPEKIVKKKITKSKIKKIRTKKSNKPTVNKFDNEIHFEAKENETIRVSLQNLDRVSALMEEIQVNKISIDDHYIDLTKLEERTNQFSHLWKQTMLTMKSQSRNEMSETQQKLYNTCADYLTEIQTNTTQLKKTMHPRINELAILSNSLQEEVRMLRLVPVATVLNTFPRLARDLAHDLNKEVELVVKGDQVKMDKMVLEGLKDPLIHLLRNAIDHGIEDPAVRTEKGKSKTGHIKINIMEEGNQILFDITDDGTGIDVKKIAKIAENKNIISKPELETMNEGEILDLIFQPGFSTKDIITDVSGRGVGLDVVKSNIINLKGHVDVTTQPGKETTIHLRVPLTLASERGLMISSAGQSFVIPTSDIERVLILKTNQIIDVEASQAIILDKHSIPLRALADILDLPKKESAVKDRFPIVVVKKGRHTVALLVEEIIGEREIVIKPFYAPLMNIPCVSGGTLSGSGLVIIVLNPIDLINKALRTTKTSRITLQDDTIAPKAKPHILVVDDSITTRTLEKNILEMKNYQVTVAVNGKEAWDLLQKQKFSLLITDVIMPIMDGFTLTERVKSSNELRNLPVIIVTSLGSESEKKRGVEVGANAYVVKSEFESGALLEIVEQLV